MKLLTTATMKKILEYSVSAKNKRKQIIYLVAQFRIYQNTVFFSLVFYRIKTEPVIYIFPWFLSVYFCLRYEAKMEMYDCR